MSGGFRAHEANGDRSLNATGRSSRSRSRSPNRTDNYGRRARSLSPIMSNNEDRFTTALEKIVSSMQGPKSNSNKKFNASFKRNDGLVKWVEFCSRFEAWADVAYPKKHGLVSMRNISSFYMYGDENKQDMDTK